MKSWHWRGVAAEHCVVLFVSGACWSFSYCVDFSHWVFPQRFFSMQVYGPTQLN